VCETPAAALPCNSSQYCPQNTTVTSLCPLGFQCATPAVKIACNATQYCPAGSTAQSLCAPGPYLLTKHTHFPH
jgi:hypothetical protein